MLELMYMTIVVSLCVTVTIGTIVDLYKLNKEYRKQQRKHNSNYSR